MTKPSFPYAALMALLLALPMLPGLALPAKATTIRYSFEITGSKIDLAVGRILDEFTMTPLAGAEREAFVAAHHTLGALQGLTGRVVLDLAPRAPLIDPTDITVNCISGPLCAAPSWAIHMRGLHSTHAGGSTIWTPGTTPFWRYEMKEDGTGRILFHDDSVLNEYVTWNGALHNWGWQTASFTLSSVSGPAIIPNPLPPAFALYVAMVLPVLWLHRRRRTG